VARSCLRTVSEDRSLGRPQHTAAMQVQLGGGWRGPQEVFKSPKARLRWGMGPRRLGEIESGGNHPALGAAVENVVGIWAAAARSGSEPESSPSGGSIGAGVEQKQRVVRKDASPKKQTSGSPWGRTGGKCQRTETGHLGAIAWVGGERAGAIVTARIRGSERSGRKTEGLEASTLTITPRSSWSSQPKATSAADGGTLRPEGEHVDEAMRCDLGERKNVLFYYSGCVSEWIGSEKCSAGPLGERELT
jgi:hypothetical protein